MKDAEKEVEGIEQSLKNQKFEDVDEASATVKVLTLEIENRCV